QKRRDCFDLILIHPDCRWHLRSGVHALRADEVVLPLLRLVSEAAQHIGSDACDAVAVIAVAGFATAFEDSAHAVGQERFDAGDASWRGRGLAPRRNRTSTECGEARHNQKETG